jgi:di/tricarboxylate transporter
MLSKEQAESVSNEFLNQARANSADTSRGSFGGSWYLRYRLPELRSLTPGQRYAILREAHSYFMRRWQTRVGYAIVLLLILTVAFRFPPDSWPAGSAKIAPALGMVIFFIFLAVHEHYIRRYVKQSLSSLK